MVIVATISSGVWLSMTIPPPVMVVKTIPSVSSSQASGFRTIDRPVMVARDSPSAGRMVTTTVSSLSS